MSKIITLKLKLSEKEYDLLRYLANLEEILEKTAQKKLIEIIIEELSKKDDLV